LEIRVIQGSITEVPSDALIVNLFEGVTAPGGATGAVDRALEGLIGELIESGEVKGNLNEVTLIHTHAEIGPKRVLVIGLGKAEEFDLFGVRKVAGTAVRSLRKKGVREATSIVHGAGIGGLAIEDAARALVQGSIVGSYQPDQYKTSDKDSAAVEKLTIVERDGDKIPAIQAGAGTGAVVANAINDARTLGNEPSNNMTPSILAERAREVANRFGLEIEVLDEARMRDLGMNALLSVAQGSAQPPRLIVLKYKSPGANRTIGFVGKGLTFDSGGISIKAHEGMEYMKFDMCGGAAVIQALRAVAELKPRINVLGLVPASENMPGSAAYKPGDVIKCLSGKTVEIITTDAEGRMMLADAITYAKRLGAQSLVDVATLTGSCVIALGNDYTGVMGSDRELLRALQESASSAGEKVWEFPLPPEYKDQLKSEIADLKNVGTKYGGAITGGLFLREFAEDTPWVHMDIAGTAYAEKEEPYRAAGATGVGVGTLASLAMRLAE